MLPIQTALNGMEQSVQNAASVQFLTQLEFARLLTPHASHLIQSTGYVFNAMLVTNLTVQIFV
jgi:hypothetical protein